MSKLIKIMTSTHSDNTVAQFSSITGHIFSKNKEVCRWHTSSVSHNHLPNRIHQHQIDHQGPQNLLHQLQRYPPGAHKFTVS